MKCKRFEKLMPETLEERHFSPNGSFTDGKFDSYHLRHMGSFEIFSVEYQLKKFS